MKFEFKKNAHCRATPENNYMNVLYKAIPEENEADELEELIIPDGVIKIAPTALAELKGIKTITVPASLRYFKNEILWCMRNIERINVPPENKYFCFENGFLYNKDKTVLIYAMPYITDCVLPDSVKKIEPFAFRRCKYMTRFVIPAELEEISYASLRDCLSCLETIEVDERNKTFYFADGVIYNKVTNAVVCAMQNLETCEIFDGIERINSIAFQHCKKLRSLTIPESVTSIGEDVFIDTPWLKAKRRENPLVVVNNILIYGRDCKDDVVIPDGVEKIVICAFKDCINITSVVIPESVTEIGCRAFSGCTNLENVYFSRNIEEIKIGKNAFRDTPVEKMLTPKKIKKKSEKRREKRNDRRKNQPKSDSSHQIYDNLFSDDLYKPDISIQAIPYQEGEVTMKNSTQLINWNGTVCVKMNAGSYEALIAYEIGANVIRLRDNDKGMEFFRWNADNTADDIRQSAEVWGLPTLYLPNRFADGKLKTSDALYQLPVNEKAPYNNHIHGFLHKRRFELVWHDADSNCAWVKVRYVYDENDEFFQYLPVKFIAEYTFTLSENGLEQDISFTNLSDKVLPMSLASHTTINSPFVDGAKEGDIRLTVPVGKKCELNERCLPTENLKSLTMCDLEYKNGTKCPVLQVVDNDMYFGEYADLDGEKFHGVIAEDTASGKKLCYEVSDEYKFWIIWNDRGFNHYFCPEPMTAMIDAPNLSLAPEVSGYVEVKPNETYTAHQRFFSK